MFVPTFDNDVSVLVNHSFNLAEIVRFDALLLCENKLRAVPLELGHTTIALHMDVQRLMFLAVEEEREPKESEYFWHISFVLLFIRHKDRNYF
jgi:hypothetical protein